MKSIHAHTIDTCSFGHTYHFSELAVSENSSPNCCTPSQNLHTKMYDKCEVNLNEACLEVLYDHRAILLVCREKVHLSNLMFCCFLFQLINLGYRIWPLCL